MKSFALGSACGGVGLCCMGGESCEGCAGVSWGEMWSCEGDSTGDSQTSESSLEGRGVVRATCVLLVRDEGTAGT